MGNSTTFAKRLSATLHDRRLMQKELAELVGIQPATISAYLKSAKDGYGKNPSIAVAIDIAKALNVSLDWLCGLSDEEDSLKKKDLDEVLLNEYLADWVVLLEKGHISVQEVVREVCDNHGKPLPYGNLVLRCNDTLHMNYLLLFFEDYKKLTELKATAVLSEELYESSLKGLIDKFKIYKIVRSGKVALVDNR